MARGAPDPAVDRLAAAVRELPGVRLAYLFGSRARGTERADSDFDIAVLLDDERARAERGATLRRLAGRLGRVVSSALLDIVILNDATPLLRHRVLRDGVLLHARTPEARVRFAVAAMRDYQDGQVRREQFTRARIQRLASDSSDGGSRDLLDQARRVARLLEQARRVP
jgi:predicted nucleotidyltransferase